MQFTDFFNGSSYFDFFYFITQDLHQMIHSIIYVFLTASDWQLIYCRTCNFVPHKKHGRLHLLKYGKLPALAFPSVHSTGVWEPPCWRDIHLSIPLIKSYMSLPPPKIENCFSSSHFKKYFLHKIRIDRDSNLRPWAWLEC